MFSENGVSGLARPVTHAFILEAGRVFSTTHPVLKPIQCFILNPSIRFPGTKQSGLETKIEEPSESLRQLRFLLSL